MKKRLRGLIALMLIMVMIIPSNVWAEDDGTVYIESFEVEYLTGMKPGDFSEETGIYATLDSSKSIYECFTSDEAGGDGTLKAGGDYIRAREMRIWEWTANVSSNGSYYYNGELTENYKVISPDEPVSVETYNQYYGVSYYTSGEYYSNNLKPYFEIIIEPNYTVPTNLTAKCGTALSDIELPAEAVCLDDGTPIGTWTWKDGTQTVSEDNSTVIAVFTTATDTSNWVINEFDGAAIEVEVEITVAHTHDIIENPTADDYESDSTGHWLVCSCGDKIDEADHTYDAGTVTKAATADADGTIEYTCTVCGYSYEETLAYKPDDDQDGDGDIDNDDKSKDVTTGEHAYLLILMLALMASVGCVYFARRRTE